MGILLTIAIPTYNRVFKLQRLVENLSNQIYDLKDEIEILISDNCSSDSTASFLSNIHISNPIFKVKTFSQKSNLGFDANISFLYNSSTGKYVWFFADDDIILPGTIKTIVETLKNESPTLLLFSFGQPPGSKIGVFRYEKTISFYQKSDIVHHIIKFPKISTYVLLKSNFNKEDLIFLRTQVGYGWMHLGLAFSLVNYVKFPILTIISEVLAECDNEFDMLTWSPNAIKESYQIYKHKLISKETPDLLRSQYISSYINSIQFCFAAKIGTLRVMNIHEYDNLISDLKFYFILFKYPKSFLQFVLLKFNLIKMYLFFTK